MILLRPTDAIFCKSYGLITSFSWSSSVGCEWQFKVAVFWSFGPFQDFVQYRKHFDVSMVFQVSRVFALFVSYGYL